MAMCDFPPSLPPSLPLSLLPLFLPPTFPLPPLPPSLPPSFPSSSSVASWVLTPPEDPQGWRHVRVRQNGPNASGQTHYLSISGLELYGEVRGLADEDLGKGVRA